MTDAFSVSFKYLTGEGWSGVMYFYMKNSDLPKYATALYFVLQYIWMRCLLFSLFVAVLLVNFAVDEDEKMPRQKMMTLAVLAGLRSEQKRTTMYDLVAYLIASQTHRRGWATSSVFGSRAYA